MVEKKSRKGNCSVVYLLMFVIVYTYCTVYCPTELKLIYVVNRYYFKEDSSVLIIAQPYFFFAE